MGFWGRVDELTCSDTRYWEKVLGCTNEQDFETVKTWATEAVDNFKSASSKSSKSERNVSGPAAESQTSETSSLDEKKDQRPIERGRLDSHEELAEAEEEETISDVFFGTVEQNPCIMQAVQQATAAAKNRTPTSQSDSEEESEEEREARLTKRRKCLELALAPPTFDNLLFIRQFMNEMERTLVANAVVYGDKLLQSIGMLLVTWDPTRPAQPLFAPSLLHPLFTHTAAIAPHSLLHIPSLCDSYTRALTTPNNT